MILDKNDPNFIFTCNKCKIAKKNSDFGNKKRDRRVREYSSTCKSCVKKYKIKYDKTDTRKKYVLKHRFNLPFDEWLALKEKQNNCCAICYKPQNVLNRNLAIDHCHTSGKVRGLLCNSCNLALGLFFDNKELLKNAIMYLEKSNDTI